VLSRKVDPARVWIVWGQVHAGGAGNVIPSPVAHRAPFGARRRRLGRASGPILTEIVDEVVAPYGVGVEFVDYVPACRRWSTPQTASPTCARLPSRSG
jgi:hypothetical protein